jgi:uncharacterized membrane protein YhhN
MRTLPKSAVASVVCSAIYLAYVIGPQLPGARLGVVFKVASIGLLIVVAATARRPRKLLMLALYFSAVGDLLLDVRKLGPLGPVQLFLFGLIAFLVAHLFYVAMLVRERSERVSAARKVACVAVVVAGLVSLRVLWPGLAEMRMPVLAYSAVLTLMAITAQVSRFGKLVAIGALLFFASDTMLAMSIFGHPFAGSRVLVWVTYYAAQAMIAAGVIKAGARELSTEYRVPRTLLRTGAS